MNSKPRLVNLPIAALALVPIYNIPGLSGELRLNGPVLAKISWAPFTAGTIRPSRRSTLALTCLMQESCLCIVRPVRG